MPATTSGDATSLYLLRRVSVMDLSAVIRQSAGVLWTTLHLSLSAIVSIKFEISLAHI
jgi:hypothetical protein